MTVALGRIHGRADAPRWTAASLLALLALPATGTPAGGSGRCFVEVSKAAGASMRHHPPVFDSKLAHIMPLVAAGAAGAAIGDYDNDGWMDIFVNDARLGTENHLLHNNHDMTFTDVTAKAGLGGLNSDGQVATTALFFDYNGDGWQDLLVVRMGVSQLFENQRDGTFRNVTAAAGITRSVNALSAVAFDFDHDGWVDFYLAGYFQDVNMFALGDRQKVLWNSWESARNGGSKVFYRNDGNGHFTEVTREVGLEDTGWTMAVGHGDIDNDGWQDVYVANDYGPDRLFHNDGHGHFEDVSARAIGVDGKHGMDAEFADYDNDGWLDIFVTNITEDFLHECNMLWHNNHDGTFTDVSKELGVCDAGWAWGGKFFDYDNDGWLDLYVANGFFAGKGNYIDVLFPKLWDKGEDPSDPAVWPPIDGMGIATGEKNVLFHNDAGRGFQRIDDCGVDVPSESRAVLVADFDNDGRPDLFVTNNDGESLLFQNRVENGNHWLSVALRGEPPNTDAIGARVTAKAGALQMLREVNGGNGFGGGSSLVQHFGLAKNPRVDRLTVRWPNGAVQEWKDIAADATVRLTQGKSGVERLAFPAPAVRAGKPRRER